MKLFLSGGGSQAFELDKIFIKELDKSKPLLYIPIAMDENKHPPSECLEWIKDYFSKFNFNKIVMKTNLNEVENLDRYSGVYIGGGNTPYLLKELKETGFFKKLQEAIKEGLPVAGGSAGAIIHAKTIIPALSCDENKVGLKDFSALNNLNDFEMWCHYEENMDKEINEYIKKYSFENVIALPEDCGIYVNGDKMQILGNSSAWFFDREGNKREMKNEEFLV